MLDYALAALHAVVTDSNNDYCSVNVARHLQEMLLRSRRVRSYSAYAATYVAVWKLGRGPLVKLLQEIQKSGI